MLNNKDSNYAAYAHYTWPVQTEYTSPQGKRWPTGRSLFLSNNMHVDISHIYNQSRLEIFSDDA